MRESRRTREGRRGEESKDPKDTNKPEDTKPGEENKALEDRLKSLEDQLKELKDKPQEPAQQPQQSGGCCGGGDKGGDDKGGTPPAAPMNGPQAMNQQGMGGPDAELSNLAAQILQASGGLGGQPGMAQPMMGGIPGAGGVPAVGGNGNPFAAGFAAGMGQGQGVGAPGANPQVQQAKQQLAQKARQYAQQGFQPQPGTRALVQGALGFDPFPKNPMQQQGGMAGMGQPGMAPLGGINPGMPMMGMGLF